MVKSRLTLKAARLLVFAAVFVEAILGENAKPGPSNGPIWTSSAPRPTPRPTNRNLTYYAEPLVKHSIEQRSVEYYPRSPSARPVQTPAAAPSYTVRPPPAQPSTERPLRDNDYVYRKKRSLESRRKGHSESHESASSEHQSHHYRNVHPKGDYGERSHAYYP